VSPDGQVWLTLRHRWADGTTHLRFDPVELLERLAALTPRPRINLILYHGVLAPRAAWRGQVVQRPGAGEAERAVITAAPAAGDEGNVGRPGDRLWADLMQRSFSLDVLACPRCGGRMRLIALIDQASVIQRILRHLGLPTGIPAGCPARAPPSLADAIHCSWGDASAVSEPCS